MLQAFKRHIEKNNFFPEGSKILATVSGGVDSVVLCYLLKEIEVDFSIAHCNFKLRGIDSERDEKFVKELSEKLDVDIYSNSFDTKKYAIDNGISTQMTARELRYSWFDELKSEHNIDFIVTAHHKNDNVETVLLNLVRGTSHKGLIGINPIKDGIVRPLLPFSKEEILAFANENNIVWREDISNQENKYKRNLVRNEIIPLFEKLNPNFINTFSENIEKFTEESLILNSQFSTYNSAVEIDEIKKSSSPLLEIWNWIEPLGFTFSDAKDIIKSFNSQSGKEYLSNSHRIVKNRDSFILTELFESIQEELTIDDFGDFQISDFRFQVSKTTDVDFDLGENIAFLNADRIKFPVKIRKWKEGDRFKPLGMKGKSKLVSDFLIDEKVSLIDKEKQLVLESNEKIVWVVGRRISEDFKVIDKQNAIKIEFKL